MKCIKNGCGIDYGHGHVYAGDLFQCPNCSISIISTNKSASYDPEYKYFEFYLQMKSDQIKEIPPENIKKYLDEKFFSKLVSQK
jgi:hypothetical protein